MKPGNHRLDLQVRQAVEAGELALWDLRPELETVHYSPPWKVRFGFPDPESADSTHFWRCRVHPDDLTPMLEAMLAHMRGSLPAYDACFRLRSNGSGYRRVHSRGRVIEGSPEGRVQRLVGTMIDLTPRAVTPAGGLPQGPRGSMSGAPFEQPFHHLLCSPPAGPADEHERERVLGLVADLLQEALDELAALRQAGAAPGPASR